MSVNRIVIAGVQSGIGKTTIATGIMAALSEGRRVQPFKAGPDYIDPTYHARACGRPSRNLDTWLVQPVYVRELFQRSCANADIAVIEGVMGLFDGRTGGGEAGSTAQIAKLLGAPVVLVVDAAKIARSAAAIVLGFRQFDPRVAIAGVILNRIAGPRHYEAVAGPIEQEAGVPVIGFLPRDDELTLPERYLGLIPAVEGRTADAYFDRLREACRRHIDLKRLASIASMATALPAVEHFSASDCGLSDDGGMHRSAAPAQLHPSGRQFEAARATGGLFPAEPVPARVRIAVARDRAFSFYYEDNLDLLRAWGAELVEFSPLADAGLPEGTEGIYLGGGFPELFAQELAENRPMHAALQEAARARTPVYAECGGLMYLGERLIDLSGRSHSMLGLIPAHSSMRGSRLSLGYRELQAQRDTLIARTDQTLRAHEFHWSVLDEDPPDESAAYSVEGEPLRSDGFVSGSVLATYMHLHFATDPRITPRLVETCHRRHFDLSP
ncbi:MAG: cobyrinate a,c-diamide synthase [Dehalococcoidia bacterium]